MSDYVSIKEYVLQKLRDNLEELQTRFGVEELSLFGSSHVFRRAHASRLRPSAVARGEDTPESDIDILYQFAPAYDSYKTANTRRRYA